MDPDYIRGLADDADPNKLWRLPALAQLELPKDQLRQLDAGVALRRHASHVADLRSLLKRKRSLLITPLSSNTNAVKAVDTPPEHERLREIRSDPASAFKYEQLGEPWQESGGGTDAQADAAARGAHDDMIREYDTSPENDARIGNGGNLNPSPTHAKSPAPAAPPPVEPTAVLTLKLKAATGYTEESTFSKVSVEQWGGVCRILHDSAYGLSGAAWSAVTKRCFDTGGNAACATVSASRCTLCPNRAAVGVAANHYRCGHCGYEGPCYGNGFSAPWCHKCGKNDKLTTASSTAHGVAMDQVLSDTTRMDWLETFYSAANEKEWREFMTVAAERGFRAATDSTRGVEGLKR